MRIEFEGHRTTTRTRDMLLEVRRLTGLPLTITQGGYNAGGVPDSADTHDRDALDLRARDLNSGQRLRAVVALRQVGFAAWLRTTRQGFKVDHIHALPIGGDLSPGAAEQVSAYRAGRNGLKGNGPDDGPRVGVITWEQYLRSHPEDEEFDMTPEQLQTVLTTVLDAQRRGDDKYEAQATAWRQAGDAYAAHLASEGKSPTEIKDALFQFYRPLWASAT